MLNLIDYIVAYQEVLGFIAAGLGAISFLPQVIRIWRLRAGIRHIVCNVYHLWEQRITMVGLRNHYKVRTAYFS